MDRRRFLSTLAAGYAAAQWPSHGDGSSASAAAFPVSDVNDPAQRDAFLDDLQRRCYRFFTEAADPVTGLVSDRASFDGAWSSGHASSAACGFALAGHALAADRGYVTAGEAADRTRTLLHSLLEVAENKEGFLYHFFDRRTGHRLPEVEASSIDTAIMLGGALVAGTRFADDAEIASMADQLYRRVNWRFMLGDNDLMHMGWTPEGGMIPHQWDRYSEGILLVLLAIGAPENAIPSECWNAWRREPVLDFNGTGFLSYPPLFVHQYPMAFFDFRGYRSPSGRSYWDNAVTAHKAQIAWMTELGRRQPERFGHYGPDLWGLTSSDSAEGYKDWGGPYEPGRYEPDRGIDGSVVPSAAAGGLPIVPEDSIRTLAYQRDRFGDRVYGRFGYVNAYNPACDLNHPQRDTDRCVQWVGNDVIGIDTGISLIQAENLRSGNVWNRFMSHPSATSALDLAGFRRV